LCKVAADYFSLFRPVGEVTEKILYILSLRHLFASYFLLIVDISKRICLSLRYSSAVVHFLLALVCTNL